MGGGSPSGLSSDFDIEHAIARLEEQITLRNDTIGRAKLQDAKLQGIKGDDLRRLEAERDACKLVAAELRADRDPRAALRAQAISTQDPFRAQAFSALHASLDNRSAFFYPPGPEGSWGLHADALAVLDGKVPPSVDTSDLVARWRKKVTKLLARRADPTDPLVAQRGELFDDAMKAIQGAFKRVRQGQDPTDYLQQRIVALEARTLADGTTGAAEAKMLRGMVQQYRNLVEGSIGSLHLSPEWLAAVSNLRAAERGGDLGATDEAWKWLHLLTSLDGRGTDNLKSDDLADGTLINRIYADEIAILDGRLPAWLDTKDTEALAEQWLAQAHDIFSNRLDPQTVGEFREYSIWSDLGAYIREVAHHYLRRGEDPTEVLQQRIAEFAQEAQADDNVAAEAAANVLRAMLKQFRDSLAEAMPYSELRLSPAWLDTVSKMRDAQRNQDLDSVLTYHRLLERLAKADEEAAAAMLAREHRITEVEEMLRQAQLFIDDSGIHPSDDYYRRFMTLERKEMLRKLLVGIDADLHRIDDDPNLDDLNRADDLDADSQDINRILAAIDADVQDLNRAGDLEAPDGAPVQNELDAYWNVRLDPIEVLEPIDGEADAVSDSVRTSVTGAAGSVEDATPPVARVLEGVETPPAGHTGGSDGTPALYRIHLQHLDQAGTTEGRRTRFHPHWGATVTEIPYSQDESVRLFYRNQRQQVMGSNRNLPLRFGSATGFLLPGFGIEEMKGLKSFCHRKNLRVDLLSGQNYARYLAETEELHQVSEAGRWFEHGALYPAELAELWERRPGRTVTARHVPKAPWLMLQDDEDE